MKVSKQDKVSKITTVPAEKSIQAITLLSIVYLD
tara:strand:+ start:330 stop:431 length:102 start_codon:yes stop_codon:yes gene_type:complete